MSDNTKHAQDPTPAQPVLVIMGVSGSGKSTVAAKLAADLGWEFAEGDGMHPESNVKKMASGIPLDDEDRWPWLDVAAAWIRARADAGRPGIITCSALKHSYRDVLRGPEVVFVHLRVDESVISDRITKRSGHFMPSSLLTSQLQTFEPLSADEHYIEVDVASTPGREADDIIRRLGLVPAAAS